MKSLIHAGHTGMELLRVRLLPLAFKIAANTFPDNEYPKESFQRTSLCIARGYARIFMGCTLIRKIQLLSSEESLVFPDESEPKSPAGEIFSWIVRVVFDQLSSLAQSSAYTWHLRSAPTYNVLTLAFTCQSSALKIGELC